MKKNQPANDNHSMELLMLDRNTWNHLTFYKLF